LEFELIGRHMDVTSEMKDYVESRLDKAPKFFDRIHGLRVIFTLDGDNYQAEIVSNLIKGNTLVAKAFDKDLYAAIDAASDKLESQLRRYNDKLKEHRVKPEAAEAVTEEEEPEEQPY